MGHTGLIEWVWEPSSQQGILHEQPRCVLAAILLQSRASAYSAENDSNSFLLLPICVLELASAGSIAHEIGLVW